MLHIDMIDQNANGSDSLASQGLAKCRLLYAL